MARAPHAPRVPGPEPSPELEAWLASQQPGAVGLFLDFRALVLEAAGDGALDERLHRTEVAWAGTRVFAVAFFLAGRLEVAIDLLRAVDHPQLRQHFRTTKKVWTHRFAFTDPGQLGPPIPQLLAEAYDSVAFGTR